MPAALIPKEEVLARLLEVFREHGYEGASLAVLSEATGRPCDVASNPIPMPSKAATPLLNGECDKIPLFMTDTSQ